MTSSTQTITPLRQRMLTADAVAVHLSIAVNDSVGLTQKNGYLGN